MVEEFKKLFKKAWGTIKKEPSPFEGEGPERDSELEININGPQEKKSRDPRKANRNIEGQ